MTWLEWLWLGLTCGALVFFGVWIIRRSVDRDD